MKIKESTKLLKLLFMLIMAIFFTACSDNDDFMMTLIIEIHQAIRKLI